VKRPIGLFDSGLGGLSVLIEIRKLLPNESLLYVADSKYCPYGEKDEEFLRRRAGIIGEFLLEEGCKAIVVACNTATAASVGMMRQRFKVPVVAVEPAVKPAAARTRSGVVGVLATRTTLQSEAYAQLLIRHAAGIEVLGADCPDWVAAVERGETGGSAAESLVAERVQPLLARGADTLVLGCTHFPFLRSAIEAAAGAQVTVLDTGEAVARQLQRRLGDLHLIEDAANLPSHRFVTSAPSAHTESFLRAVWPDLADIETFPR
jgi:glutamate racemase